MKSVFHFIPSNRQAHGLKLMFDCCRALTFSGIAVADIVGCRVFLKKLLYLGLLDHIFTIVDWASQILLIFDQSPEKKLLLHFKILHECLIAPTNLIGLFIGQVKKKSSGKADPKRTNELLIKALS